MAYVTSAGRSQPTRAPHTRSRWRSRTGRSTRDRRLFHPDTRAYFDRFAGPYVPHSDIALSWNPEFFGNAMVVDGRTWPEHRVEQRRYRLRLLNGCGSRFLILALAADAAVRPVKTAAEFWQVGADGVFPKAPVSMERRLSSRVRRVRMHG